MANLTARQHRSFALKYDLYMINGWMSDFDIHHGVSPVAGLVYASDRIGVYHTDELSEYICI